MLLELKQTLLALKSNKTRVKKETTELCTRLIEALRIRKNQVHKTISNYYDDQLSKIQTQEKRWVAKQSSCYDLSQLGDIDDPLTLVRNSQKIINDLKIISEKIRFQ